MDDLQIIKAGTVVAIVVLSLSVHEAAHAWVADLRGDRTARSMGRLTLNPMAHIDPMWTVVIPLLMYVTAGFAFGGAAAAASGSFESCRLLDLAPRFEP